MKKYFWILLTLTIFTSCSTLNKTYNSKIWEPEVVEKYDEARNMTFFGVKNIEKEKIPVEVYGIKEGEKKYRVVYRLLHSHDKNINNEPGDKVYFTKATIMTDNNKYVKDFEYLQQYRKYWSNYNLGWKGRFRGHLDQYDELASSSDIEMLKDIANTQKLTIKFEGKEMEETVDYSSQLDKIQKSINAVLEY